jgi:hypothetical protein
VRGAEEGFDAGEIFGAGDFGVRAVAGDEADGLGDEFARSGVVGNAQSASADFSEGASDDLDAECLRGLDGPEL